MKTTQREDVVFLKQFKLKKQKTHQLGNNFTCNHFYLFFKGSLYQANKTLFENPTDYSLIKLYIHFHCLIRSQTHGEYQRRSGMQTNYIHSALKAAQDATCHDMKEMKSVDWNKMNDYSNELIARKAKQKVVGWERFNGFSNRLKLSLVLFFWRFHFL